MKMIIDIPEIMLDWIKNGFPDEEDMNILIELVLNGKPLDDLRAEINAIEISGQIDEHTLFARSADGVKNMALNIIDKYRK